MGREEGLKGKRATMDGNGLKGEEQAETGGGGAERGTAGNKKTWVGKRDGSKLGQKGRIVGERGTAG